MGEPHIFTTLRRKRAEIEAVIAAYEAKIEAARMDLAEVDRIMRLFSPDAGCDQIAAYFEMGRLWKRGEIVAVCREALGREGPLDTPELASRVAKAKGLDEQDAIMFKSVALRVARALSNALRREIIWELGKRKGVRVWRL